MVPTGTRMMGGGGGACVFVVVGVGREPPANPGLPKYQRLG
jgi:hypothetical protein